jgi:acetylornithine deacetylase/succinyl-diaminopimelate desuccinylase-like protein
LATTERQLTDQQLAELSAFLAIPSVSASAQRKAATLDAASWLSSFISEAGGEAAIRDWSGSPLLDATLHASSARNDAPTILCYGHFDVQPPGERALWENDPFQATISDGWLTARGVADDKGQLWALAHAATQLARAGQLPVNVRFCCDGEEEIGGTSIVEFLSEHAGSPAACVIFDTPMLDSDTHVFTTATRGTLYLHLEVQTGRRDLHSGIYGGAALNALHVLIRALDGLFDHAGQLVAPLRAGMRAASASERQEWARLPRGDTLLAEQGAAVLPPSAGSSFYSQTWELPSLDINGIEGGSPVEQKTIVVAQARANVSMRLAAGQTATRLQPLVEQILQDRIPAGAHLEVTQLSACDPGQIDRDAVPLRLARDAFARVLGKPPLLLRSGGSLPIMPLLEKLGIPGIVTGFAVPDSNMHAPNERMRLTGLADAVAAAREMFLSFEAL